MKVEFKAGNRVVKCVSSMTEADRLIKELLDVRNNNSLWEIIERTRGNNIEAVIPATEALDEIMGTMFDVFDVNLPA